MVNSNQAVVLTAVGLAVVALVVGVIIFTSVNLQTHGTIVTNNPDIDVFADQECTKEISAIEWGNINAGGSSTVTIFVRNSGNVPLTMSMATSNYDPASAQNYLTLTWNQENTWLSPSSVIPCDFILSASPLVVDITEFRFQVEINGTG